MSTQGAHSVQGRTLLQLLPLLAAVFVLLPAAVQSANPAPSASSAKPAPSAKPANRGPVNPPPTQQDWLSLSKLPDWSGVWVPNVTDQMAQVDGNTPPWTPAVAKQMAFLAAEEQAGRPLLILAGCLPTGMPGWMLISHNAMEVLYTPGRVTLLGEGDGNRMRRIYTDGRAHPDDPDLSFHGHSIGHWEQDTLVVDTVGVLPQAWIVVSEAVGVPNGGDMHIVERIRLARPDYLEDELTITAPKVLSKPWQTRRGFFRHRARSFDIVEGVCAQGAFEEGVDRNGNPVFVPLPQSADGSVVPRSP
jgi:hypothetical protein